MNVCGGGKGCSFSPTSKTKKNVKYIHTHTKKHFPSSTSAERLMECVQTVDKNTNLRVQREVGSEIDGPQGQWTSVSGSSG